MSAASGMEESADGNEQTTRTWDIFEMAVLNEIGRAEQAGTEPEIEAALDRAGCPEHRMPTIVKRLKGEGFIEVHVVEAMGGVFQFLSARLTGQGARVVGFWPSNDPFEDLIRRLDQLIADADGDVEKTKLQKLRDAAYSLGGDAVRAVLGEIIRATIAATR